MKGLFGNEISETIPRKLSGKYEIWRAKNQYKKQDKNKCATCKHHLKMEHHCKIYHKCRLQGCSRSEASDIRVSYGCLKWERMGK